MTWWFWCLCLRRRDLHEDALLCKEARGMLDRFPEVAKQAIDGAVQRAAETVGPAAMRSAFSDLVDASMQKRPEPGLASVEAALSMTQRVSDDPIGCIAEWSMTTLSQAIDVYETGGGDPKEPAIEEINAEALRLADAIKALSWKGKEQ